MLIKLVLINMLIVTNLCSNINTDIEQEVENTDQKFKFIKEANIF